MIENKTVFSYVLPSTGNLVEYRGLNAKYGSYELDALDAAVLVRLGTSSSNFPSSQAALEVYNTSGSKYLINGWPGSQADNLNFVGVDGNQYYLSNRFINTGTAIPTYFTTKANFRCVATNNWFGYVDVSWQWYSGNTIRPVLETVYNQTGVEYRIRIRIDYIIVEDSSSTSNRASVYITRSTGLNSWNQYYSKRVGGSTISRCSWWDEVVQRNVDGTWVDICELRDEGGDATYTGNIGPFSNGAATYYGKNTGSGGVDAHLSIYDT
jgi:hypothetical protein